MLFIAFALMMSGIALSQAQAASFPGNINCDISVDMKDAILGLKIAASISTTDNICMDGDVNKDGKIGMEEAVFILRFIAFSENLESSMTLEPLIIHLSNLQDIAARNSGNREAGTSGYEASAAYIENTLKDKGFIVSRQPVSFRYYRETEEPEFQLISPESKLYAQGTDFLTMTYSGMGDVIAQIAFVTPIISQRTDSNSSADGCEESDFDQKDLNGKIAVIQRGSCDYKVKAQNAQNKGAKAVIIFNEGQEGRTGAVSGTLGEESRLTIPVIGVSYDIGKYLYDQDEISPVTARVSVIREINETIIADNVLAETSAGNENQVVMLGAHLDSVAEGPGINDNGSGTAALLELAVQIANKKDFKPLNKLRFAWWAAEEQGLRGSYYYTENLTAEEKAEIGIYLNFDMIASNNYYLGVEDGDFSDSLGDPRVPFSPEDIPSGSDEIEKAFKDYFMFRGLVTYPSVLEGRTDYRPFLRAGIPFGGVFAGADRFKTAEQAVLYGGTADMRYDTCYHKPCDNVANLNQTALLRNAKAIAYVTQLYAEKETLFTATKTTRERAESVTAKKEVIIKADKYHKDRLSRSAK